MYEKYLEQLEEAGKIRNLKERSINCYKNYVSYFPEISLSALERTYHVTLGLFACHGKKG